GGLRRIAARRLSGATDPDRPRYVRLGRPGGAASSQRERRSVLLRPEVDGQGTAPALHRNEERRDPPEPEDVGRARKRRGRSYPSDPRRERRRPHGGPDLRVSASVRPSRDRPPPLPPVWERQVSPVALALRDGGGVPALGRADGGVGVAPAEGRLHGEGRGLT